MRHSFSDMVVCFCDRCGMSMVDVVESGVNECAMPEGVTSIIPSMRRKQLDAVIGPIVARLLN